MKRAIDQILKQWKDSRIRQPLLIRGARQVGKTYSVTEFGRTAFRNTVSVNFEEQKTADYLAETVSISTLQQGIYDQEAF